jgi:PhnB protein
MAKVSIYLNFQGKTEEAFNFYKSVFKTEFASPIMKMADMLAPEGKPPLSDEDKSKVMQEKKQNDCLNYY